MAICDNNWKVCKTCGSLSHHSIDACPQCRKSNFRPMEENEKRDKEWTFFSPTQPGGVITEGRGYNIF